MRAVPIILSSFLLDLIAAEPAYPTITPAPALDSLELRQSDDCNESGVRSCEEQRWSILFRAPICRSASNRNVCSCSAAEAQSACYVVYCKTAPENVSSKVQSECGAVSTVSGFGSRSRSISRVTPTTTTTTTIVVTGAAGLGKSVNPRLLMAMGGLLAMEL